MSSDEFKEIYRKLALLETHVINFVTYMQDLSKTISGSNILSLLNKPLQIDTKTFARQLEYYNNTMRDFKKNIDDLKNSQPTQELRFIGKRLDTIENDIKLLKENGLTKKVDIEFIVDGYPLVKKPVNHEEGLSLVNLHQNIKDLLDTLTERESFVLTHRFGLLGETKKTLKDVGALCGITGNAVRVTQLKALRKCRHPTRSDLVKKIKHHDLLKAIGG